MEVKIKQQTAIYAICCSIFCSKKVAANSKIDCLMLDFQLSFDQQKAKKLFVDGIFTKRKAILELNGGNFFKNDLQLAHFIADFLG